MINRFHINPWWYLATIPFGISLIGAMFAGLYKYNLIIPIIIISLCILFFLYITNIIGLLDMIFLFIIIFNFISIELSIFNIILIPFAMGLSFAFRK